jgi:hypothetical protein
MPALSPVPSDAPTIMLAERVADVATNGPAVVAHTLYTGGGLAMENSDVKELNGMAHIDDSQVIRPRRGFRGLAVAAAGALLLAGSPAMAQGIAFDLVRSAGAETANCLVDAEGTVTVDPHGGVEVMKIKIKHMPANTVFDVFVIQVPSAPFGLSWYQGDITTNARGVGHGTFKGRFNIETFIVAPGSTSAPVVHTDPIADASTNPATGPVHTYHIGLWFDSPDAAAAAGCPATVTPFNGDHSAGIQALSTKQFAADQGPLRQLQ